MKLYKVDTQQWTVRAVEGEPWPGYDSDGDQCYENTHYKDEAEAWENLKGQSMAYVSLVARQVQRARDQLKAAEQESADAVVALEKVSRAHDKRLSELAT